jgi:hypothetical protein
LDCPRDNNSSITKALTYYHAGLSIIPIRADGSKAPAIATWNCYRERSPTETDIKKWFNGQLAGIAVVCGRVSGGIEVIDFDAPNAFDQWAEIVSEQLQEILKSLPIVQTPSGYGRHVYLKRKNPKGGTKLALQKNEKGESKVIIETRGEGNYVLVPGCPPQCHPTGNIYKHFSGPPIENLPLLETLDDTSYGVLISAAKALNEYIPPDRTSETPEETFLSEGRPGDEFNQTVSWQEILEQHGWKLLRMRGSVGYWQRPGKDNRDQGLSATTGYCFSPHSNELFYVFSTNAHPFEHETAYSKFATYALLNHDGDFKVAAKALAEKGFGIQRAEPSIDYSPSKPTNPILLWQPFPIEVLPEPIRSYVVEGSKALGCDISMIALPLMAALASAIGNTRRIELKSTWTAPSIIWEIIIAESGTLKSPAMDLALDPLRTAEDEVLESYYQMINVFEAQKLEYEAELIDWKHSDRKSGAPPPDKPQEPVCTRYIVSDITIEALAPILLNNPRGVLLARDELAGWLCSFDAFKKNRGMDVAQWLELHRAGRLIVDRKTGPLKTIHIPRAAVSISGTIQSGTLQRVLTPGFFENGLAARLLLAMPPRKPKKWSEAIVPDILQAKISDLFRRLLKIEFNHDHEKNEPVNIPLTVNAKPFWVDFYNDISKAQSAAESPMAAALSKLEEYAARFALVFTMVRYAAMGAFRSGEIAVDEVSMSSGINLARWFTRETGRIYKTFNEPEEEHKQRILIEYIQVHGGRITVRGLYRGRRQYRGEGGQKRAEQDLIALEKSGIGRFVDKKPEGPGRPVKVFVLNDDINDTSYHNLCSTRIVSPSPPNETSHDGMADEPSSIPDHRVIVSPPLPENGHDQNPETIRVLSPGTQEEEEDWGEV